MLSVFISSVMGGWGKFWFLIFAFQTYLTEQTCTLPSPVDGGRLDDQLDFWDVGTRGLSSLRSIAHFWSATQLHVIHSPMTACAHMSVVFHFIQITGLWMDGMKWHWVEEAVYQEHFSQTPLFSFLMQVGAMEVKLQSSLKNIGLLSAALAILPATCRGGVTLLCSFWFKTGQSTTSCMAGSF